MSILLHIDTATAAASICLSAMDEVIDLASNSEQQDHAGWLHTAIDQVLKKNNLLPEKLDAVSVSIGPGSYTGLRVGLATAKGLCYALNIPLITISTLKMMAFAVKDELPDATSICPMIDARRMEVFTAVYDTALAEKKAPRAMIVDEHFEELFDSNEKIIFCGGGSMKLQRINRSFPHFISNTEANAGHLAKLAATAHQENNYANLAYAEPMYIKEFYNSPTR